MNWLRTHQQESARLVSCWLYSQAYYSTFCLIRPSRPMTNRRSRQVTSLPAKDAAQTANEYRSQTGLNQPQRTATLLWSASTPVRYAEAMRSAPRHNAGAQAPKASAANIQIPACAMGSPAYPLAFETLMVRAQRSWCRQMPAQVASP